MADLAQTETSSRDWLSITQLIASGLGIALALLAAGLLFLFALVGLFSETVGAQNAVPLFSLAWLSLIIAILTAPSMLYSFRRIWGSGPNLRQVSTQRVANLVILLWPLVLVLGNALAGQSSVAWLVLPPLQILAIGLPVLWFLSFASRKLSAGSPQRAWGVLNFGMLVTTPVVIMVELLVMGALFIAAVVWISFQPDLMQELERLGRRIIALQPDPEMILEYLRPYLQNPLVIFGVLAMIAGLVPLIEEMLKPLALWALVGRQLTPQQGFVAGAISGASFALLESLMSFSDPAQGSWAALAAGRAGTALLHITTTSLVGWALASAWQNGKYLRLGGVYLLAVFLHSAWNALSVFAGLSAVFADMPENLGFLGWVVPAASIGLIVLILFVFMLLWYANRSLQRAQVNS